MLGWSEDELQACRVVVDVRGSARTCQAFLETPIDQWLRGFRRGPAGVLKRREKELYVVGDWVAQQVQDPADPRVREREPAVFTHMPQEAGCRRPAPSCHPEGRKVVDGGGQAGAAQHPFETDGTAKQESDLPMKRG